MSAVAAQMPAPLTNPINAPSPSATGYQSPASMAAQAAVVPYSTYNPSSLVSNQLVAQQGQQAAKLAANAPPVTTPQTIGAGQFSVTAPPPTTITNPALAGGIGDFAGDLPYLTASQNAANAQEYATLTAGENLLGQGYQSSLGQLSTAGASEEQQLQLQQQQTIGQSESQMAQAGLTGSSAAATATAQANRTYNLAATSLQEQVAAAKASVIQQGTSAMAQYLAAPEYTNDNSTLLQGMAAQSNVQLSNLGIQSQSNAASAANNAATTNAGIAGGTSLISGLLLAAALL